MTFVAIIRDEDSLLFHLQFSCLTEWSFLGRADGREVKPLSPSLWLTMFSHMIKRTFLCIPVAELRRIIWVWTPFLKLGPWKTTVLYLWNPTCASKRLTWNDWRELISIMTCLMFSSQCGQRSDKNIDFIQHSFIHLINRY